MSDVAIRVEGLSKQYPIGARPARYKMLRDTLAGMIATPVRALRSGAAFRGRNGRDPKDGDQKFWALKDLSFEVRRGEVVGIIGRNGAGKSTLLKILSRITEPTTGYADVYGRIGSLLEVGTGFHPELTGRENVYLNGAILGMRRAEIDRKFDEIVTFSEVETFIDTPVKHYSSGMYLRLAFAVAAYLDPEILIVDEVLAVGDREFQKKCLGKIDDVSGQGRTVLFVSHNMSVVKSLCRRSVLLEQGQIACDGETSQVIGHYLSDAITASRVSLEDWGDRVTSGEGRLKEFEIFDGTGSPTNRVSIGDAVGFAIHAELFRPFFDPCFALIIHNSLGEPILNLRSLHDGLRFGMVQGRVSVRVWVKSIGLYPGRYFLSPCVMDRREKDIDFTKLCCILEIDPAPGPHGDLQLDPAWGKYWVPAVWCQSLSDSG